MAYHVKFEYTHVHIPFIHNIVRNYPHVVPVSSLNKDRTVVVEYHVSKGINRVQSNIYLLVVKIIVSVDGVYHLHLLSIPNQNIYYVPVFLYYLYCILPL